MTRCPLGCALHGPERAPPAPSCTAGRQPTVCWQPSPPSPKGTSMSQHARLRFTVLPILAALAACGDGGNADPPTASTGSDLAVLAGEPFPEERCAANREAGTITFLTGFDYAAASSIVEVITADDLGYYDELCLDVEITPSFSTANYALVAGGQGQFASGGSFSEVVAFADVNEADLVAVTVAGTSPIDTLILKPGIATELSDLAGTTIGVKGKLPPSIEVMLLEAGLVAEQDFTTVPLEGFDPLAHIAIDSIVGFPGWKSNEPGRLAAEHVDFVQFDASNAGVPGSFGAIFTTRQFIDDHPTATEDFVRATLRGLAAAIADPKAAALATVELVDDGRNPDTLLIERETFRWETETKVIENGIPARTIPGVPSTELLQAEIEAYAAVGLFGAETTPVADDYVDQNLSAGLVTDSGFVIWPS